MASKNYSTAQASAGPTGVPRGHRDVHPSECDDPTEWRLMTCPTCERHVAVVRGWCEACGAAHPGWKWEGEHGDE